jgi:hypothetical protein
MRYVVCLNALLIPTFWLGFGIPGVVAQAKVSRSKCIATCIARGYVQPPSRCGPEYCVVGYCGTDRYGKQYCVTK